MAVMIKGMRMPGSCMECRFEYKGICTAMDNKPKRSIILIRINELVCRGCPLEEVEYDGD